MFGVVKLMAILDQLARNQSLQQSAKRITKGNDLWQDLFQYSLLKLYDQGEDRIVGIHKEGNISGYMAVVMHREWHDNTSKFNKSYRPHQETSLQNIPLTDENGEAMYIQKSDISLCKEYFGEECNISPERVVLSRAMQKMQSEDNKDKHFHYRTALLELYIQHGGISQVSRETGIDRTTVRKDIKTAIELIKKNGEGTTH